MSESAPEPPKIPDPAVWSRNMAEIAARSQRLVTEFLSRQGTAAADGGMGPVDPLNVGNAFLEMTRRMMANPGPVIEAQFSLWQDYMRLWQSAAERFLGGNPAPVVQPAPSDQRFKDEAWHESTLLDFIKQSYLPTARWTQSTGKKIDGLDDKTAQKVDFYTRQFVDAIAPTNVVATNPEALCAAVESGGEHLVNGLKNLLEDLERGNGRLMIKMTDLDSFKVGKNIAVSPGKVVFRDDLIELIQYAPATAKVQKTPLLIVPPWINKFYILDLRPTNSFVKWAVEQGHTVFMVSWANPDEHLAEKTFDDYLLEGPFAALDAIAQATGEKQVNIIGYCLGGTLVAALLAYLAAKGDGRIKSATFFASLVDFKEAGDLSVFIDDEQLTSLEERMSKHGYLEGADMATTFNMLRANDLIWSFVVNNYLLGKEPFPFDLLYWNSDSTRMPAAMHSFYLRRMYQENQLARPGGIVLAGVPIDLRKVKTPTFILSTKEDHIAPWKSTYVATQLYAGPVTFVLAASGHIAGVINPPGKVKYGHWTNDKLPKDPKAWLKAAQFHDGSWWPRWEEWVKQFAGGDVDARQPGDGKLKPLADAPGTYVMVKSQT